MNIQQAVQRDAQRARQAVADFVHGAALGDIKRMTATFDSLDYGKVDGGGWMRAMRAVSRLPSVPRATQSYFLQIYLQYGDHIRQECNDLILADGLRVLLPTYKGRAHRLYRGESFPNRSRRTYGLSWTACRDVAHAFAKTGFYRTFMGGSVLLEILAPADAIICAPALLDDRYAEEEYIVDRRLLTSVKAIERFRQLSHDEFRATRGESADA